MYVYLNVCCCSLNLLGAFCRDVNLGFCRLLLKKKICLLCISFSCTSTLYSVSHLFCATRVLLSINASSLAIPTATLSLFNSDVKFSRHKLVFSSCFLFYVGFSCVLTCFTFYLPSPMLFTFPTLIKGRALPP